MRSHGHEIQVAGRSADANEVLCPGTFASSITETSDPPWLSSSSMALALGGNDKSIVGCGSRNRDGWETYLKDPPGAIRSARRFAEADGTAEWNPIELVTLLIRHSTSRLRRGPAFLQSDAQKLFKQSNARMPDAWRQRWLNRDKGVEG